MNLGSGVGCSGRQSSPYDVPDAGEIPFVPDAVQPAPTSAPQPELISPDEFMRIIPKPPTLLFSTRMGISFCVVGRIAVGTQPVQENGPPVLTLVLVQVPAVPMVNSTTRPALLYATVQLPPPLSVTLKVPFSGVMSTLLPKIFWPPGKDNWILLELEDAK